VAVTDFLSTFTGVDAMNASPQWKHRGVPSKLQSAMVKPRGFFLSAVLLMPVSQVNAAVIALGSMTVAVCRSKLPIGRDLREGKRRVMKLPAVIKKRWAAGEFVPCPTGCGWGQWLAVDGRVAHGSRFAWRFRQQ